mmetsp:Transcript_13475/g.49036  ORF Transcript_13475/g.49036 Transcript_13475/m.49036 type:complete len:611 (+) Transcript_13475:157-1989(+)
MERYRRRSKIDEATTNDESTPPVWVLDDILAILDSGDYDAIKDTADYFAKKCDSNKVLVKIKALRSLKYLCFKADVTFRRDLQKNAQIIRNLQMYKGAEDALKGDADNKRVRELAKEVVKLMYEGPAASPDAGSLGPAAPAAASYSGKIQGFGSDSARGESKSGSSGSGSTGISKFISFRGGNKDTGAGKTSSGSSGRGFGFGSKAQDDKKATSSASEQGGSSYSVEQVSNAAMSSGGAFTNKSQLQAMVGSEEARIVNDVTAPGGVRPQPTREELANFVNVAFSVDSGMVVSALAAKLGEMQWQVKLKALCAIEALCTNPKTEHYKDLFTEYQGEIESLLEMPQSSVKERAKKVLVVIGAREAEAPAPRKVTPQPAPAVDLLGELDAGVAQQEPAGAAPGDMFSGMSMSSPAQQAPMDPFAQQPPAATATGPAASTTENSAPSPLSEDMFSNLSISNGNGSTATADSSVPQAPQPGFGMQTMQQGPGLANGPYLSNPGVGMVPPPGMAQPGMMQPGMMQPGMMQPGMMQPGMMQPGMMQPGMMPMGQGMTLPGMPPPMQGGLMQPGMMQPGMVPPGTLRPVQADSGKGAPKVGTPKSAAADDAFKDLKW